MIRQHKKMILLTSIATLLPILIGLLLWKQLPDSVATHWSTGNEPDGYSSKAFAVFGLPVIMLILHLVCVIATNIDPKANSINKKIFFIVLWICPVFSNMEDKDFFVTDEFKFGSEGDSYVIPGKSIMAISAFNGIDNELMLNQTYSPLTSRIAAQKINNDIQSQMVDYFA